MMFLDPGLVRRDLHCIWVASFGIASLGLWDDILIIGMYVEDDDDKVEDLIRGRGMKDADG